MTYIGYTLSGCLDSMRRKEVSENEVMLIIAGTKCEDYKAYIKVVETYIVNWTTIPAVCLSEEQIMEVASNLYVSGRIHQPRLTLSAYKPMPGEYAGVFNSIWGHVIPTTNNTTPAVVAAWEHYRMLDSLTK